jgi:uncharacterized phiE125 gp8 family phage protein
VAPAANVVTLDEVKAQLFYTGTAQDTHITQIRDAAEGMLDGLRGLLNRSILTQTWRLELDCFHEKEIRLPLGPVQSVASVVYMDVDGVEQTLDAQEYRFICINGIDYLVSKHGYSWPTTQSERGAVKITYVAGFHATAAPKPIKQLTLHMCYELYHNRGLTIANAMEDPTINSVVATWGVASFGNV